MSKGVSGTITGSWEGWTPVIEKHYQSLMKYGLKLTKGNSDYALDVVHEAISRVLESNHVPRVTKAAFSYLRTAVTNVFLDTKKESKRLVSYDDEQNSALCNQLVDEWTSKAMQNRLEDEELRQRLQVAPGPLDKRERKLWRMHDVEGLKPKAIALELGEDPHAISYELNRIGAKLRYRRSHHRKAS